MKKAVKLGKIVQLCFALFFVCGTNVITKR